MIDVYIGLGSNLDQPLNQLHQAVKNLSQLPQTQILKISKFYWTKPVGCSEQPNYLNAVVKLATQLKAEMLLEHLLIIEKQQGRTRDKQRWGPRTLDLDILLYGDEIITTSNLQIPHPRMKERAFVLYPLTEIEPNLILPTGEKIKNLLSHIQGYSENFETIIIF